MKATLNSDFSKKVISSFLGQFSVSFLSIVITFTLAKLFDVKVFGEYTYIITLLSMISIFIRMGMDNSLVYFIINKGDMYNIVSFLIVLILTLFVFIGFIFFSSNTLLITSIPLIFILASQELFFAIYKAKGEIKNYFLIKIIFTLLLQLVLIVLFYYLSNTKVSDLIIIYYIVNLITLTILYYFSKNSFKKYYFDYEFIKYSIPTMFIAIIGMFMNRIDLLMIGHFMPVENVALYQVVAQISTLISILLAIFNIAFAPKIAELYKNNEFSKLKNIYVRATRIIFTLSAGLFILVVLYNNAILNYFGSEYTLVESTLIIRCFGQLTVVFVGSVGFMLTMTGQVNKQLSRIIIASIINIVLNYILIPLYGLDGAAIATALALFISSFIGYILVYRIFKIKVYKIF